MFGFPNRVRSATFALLALWPIHAVAQDVRPVFDDAALDAALSELNSHLQARYRHDDIMASLATRVPRDFQRIATATAQTPLTQIGSSHSEFGSLVTGGASLDLHLAGFHADLRDRQLTLFARLASLGVGGTPDFDSVSRDVWTANAPLTGQVFDDRSLDKEMAVMSQALMAFDSRAARLAPSASGVTSGSFDRYGMALLLLY